MEMWNLNIWMQLCVFCCPCGDSSCVLCVLCGLADCGMPVCCVCLCTGTSRVYVVKSKRRHEVCCCPGVATVVYVVPCEAPRCICDRPRDVTRGNQVVGVRQRMVAGQNRCRWCVLCK